MLLLVVFYHDVLEVFDASFFDSLIILQYLHCMPAAKYALRLHEKILFIFMTLCHTMPPAPPCNGWNMLRKNETDLI